MRPKKEAKTFLLDQGTNVEYGARHLKRTIERLVVQGISNLISSDQVRGGDWILADYDENERGLRFTRQAENLPVKDLARLVDTFIAIPPIAERVGLKEQ